MLENSIFFNWGNINFSYLLINLAVKQKWIKIQNNWRTKKKYPETANGKEQVTKKEMLLGTTILKIASGQSVWCRMLLNFPKIDKNVMLFNLLHKANIIF